MWSSWKDADFSEIRISENEFLSRVNSIPILRKSMQTDTSLICWGWFYSPEFRFEAHGFHSLNLKEVEAAVSAGLSLQHGLTHEVLVSKGGTFTLYRIGQKMYSIPTPRQCPRHA